MSGKKEKNLQRNMINPVQDYIERMRYAKEWIAYYRPEKTEEARDSLAHLVAMDIISIPSLQMLKTKHVASKTNNK